MNSILIACRYDPRSAISGTERYVRELANALSVRGVRVRCTFGSEKGGPDVDSMFEVEPIPHHGPFRSHAVHAEMKRRAPLWASTFDEVLGMGAGGAAALPDDSHRTGTFMLPGCVAGEYKAMREFAHRPLAVKDHALYWYLIDKERSAVKRAAKLIGTSRATVEQARVAYGVSGADVLLGLAPPKLSTSREPRENLVLHVATSHERKGTASLIRAVARIPGLRRPTVIIVGPHSRYYKEYARSRGVDARFAGRLSDPELTSLYQRVRVLTVPSIDEGFCLPIVEAAFAETATVATRAGSIPELVVDRQTGYLADVGDDEALGQAIDAMCSDEYRAFGAAARVHALSRFTIDHSADRLLEVLNA